MGAPPDRVVAHQRPHLDERTALAEHADPAVRFGPPVAGQSDRLGIAARRRVGTLGGLALPFVHVPVEIAATLEPVQAGVGRVAHPQVGLGVALEVDGLAAREDPAALHPVDQVDVDHLRAAHRAHRYAVTVALGQREQQRLDVVVRRRVVVVDHLVRLLREDRQRILQGHQPLQVDPHEPHGLQPGRLRAGVAAEEQVGGIAPADEQVAVGRRAVLGAGAVVDDCLTPLLQIAQDHQHLAAVPVAVLVPPRPRRCVVGPGHQRQVASAARQIRAAQRFAPRRRLGHDLLAQGLDIQAAIVPVAAVVDASAHRIAGQAGRAAGPGVRVQACHHRRLLVIGELHDLAGAGLHRVDLALSGAVGSKHEPLRAADEPLLVVVGVDVVAGPVGKLHHLHAGRRFAVLPLLRRKNVTLCH